MKNTLWIGVAALWLQLLCARAETLIDLDFSAAGAIAKQPVRQERVRGELPQGWIDDSAFAQIWAEYSFDDEQGTRFQRTSVTRIEDNWAQLAVYPLADAPGERLYRLSLTCRNRTGSDVTIGLRQRDKPYSFYWKKSFRLSENWESCSWEFRLQKNDRPMGLWMTLHQAGTFDIRKIRLERFSEEALVRELKERYPQGGPANLAQVTRFPLGLPTGWSISRESSDGDDVTVGPAAGADSPALRLASATHTTLYSAPVGLLCPVEPHTAALAVRGSGDWELFVFGPALPQRAKPFKAAPEWQRVELSFATSPRNSFCQIGIAGRGELFIDQLQVGPGSRAGGRYAAPAQCEVAAALAPGYDAGAARVVFDDEDAAVELALTGDFAGAAVKWRIFDIAEAEIGRGEVAAAERLTIRDLPKSYGSFRLEARAESAGQPLSPWSELVWHQLHRPRYWGRDAPDSPFGVHTLPASRHLIMAKAIGINWTRLHDAGLEYIGWWNLEPERGQWRFFDRELRRYRAHGIKIFAELGTAPAWASHYPESGLKTFGYFDKFFQPKELNDYARYVQTVCERYRTEIDAFDVWNEPWIHAWWGVGYDHSKSGRAGYLTSTNAAADFVRLMQCARETVHRTLPQAQVFGFNTTTSDGNSPSSFGGRQWTQGVLDAGGMAHCDGIAYHCYTAGGVGYPGDSVETGLANAIGPILKKHGQAGKPIWMTEGSPLIHRMGNGLYQHTLPYAHNDESLASADRIARYQISLLANGVSRMFIYSMHCHDGRFSAEAKDWNAFTTDDGALHPAGAAHAQTAWMLEDTRFTERLNLGRGVYAALFEGHQRAVAAISSAPEFETRRISLDKNVRASDLFGNALPEEFQFCGQTIYLEAATCKMLKEALVR